MTSYTASAPASAREGAFKSLGKMGLPASLRQRENVTLLGLALVLSLGYIALQSIRQRSSEKRAFERKRRLLGISANPPVSTASIHTAICNTEAKGPSSSSRKAISLVSRYAWRLSRLLYLDKCVEYVEKISPPTIRRLFNRRRKEKAASNVASAPAGASQETRGRAGTVTLDSRPSPSSSPASVHQSHQKNSLSTLVRPPNSPHTPSARPNARRQASSSAHASSATSRSRSGTHATKQQPQQLRATNDVATAGAVQANQPVMKHVGVQVSSEDLAAFPSQHLADVSSQQPELRQGKGKGKKNASANSSTASTVVSSGSSVQVADATEPEQTDLEMACFVPLPVDDESTPTFPSSSYSEAEQTLSRHGTITNRTVKGNAQHLTTRHSSTTNSRRGSHAKESIQSPTCSSSGRSTSLSVSTDATGLTSLTDEQEVLPTSFTAPVSKHGPNEGKSSPQQVQRGLQPPMAWKSLDPVSLPASLESGPTDTSSHRSPPRPSMLSYSFHSGFQEPSMLEDGEIAEPAPMMSSPKYSRQDGALGLHGNSALGIDLNLPSSPDNHRKIQVDAMGYPSIPIQPTISSASSSAQNSPSSARRAVSASTSSRPPISSISPQTEGSERKPSNAHPYNVLQSETYPASLDAQSSSAYRYMPTSSPSVASPAGMLGHSAPFNHPPLASPQTFGMGFYHQQQQMQQYVAQAQYQYQLQQQQQLVPTAAGGHGHPPTGHARSYMHPAMQSPLLVAQASPGLLNPMQGHLHHSHGPHSSSGGSNRSSIHLKSNSQISSRSTSPQPSSTYSFSTERHSSTGVSTAPTEGDASMQATSGQPHQDTNGLGQSQGQQLHNQNHMDLVQKMMLMQAQIQYAMQQNVGQSQQPQVQQHSADTTAGNPGPTTMGGQNTFFTSTGPPLPSPFLQSTGQQQAFSPFLLSGIGSPLNTGTFPHSLMGEGHSSTNATSPYQQYAPQYQQTQPVAGPSSFANTANTARPFPTVRRRQSTPALGADPTMSGFGTSQATSNGSPYGNSRRRNRRNSRPFRMSSYGQVLDSPDYHLTSPSLDTSAHYDAEVDMSTTSSSYTSAHRPSYDRRRSSLVPPVSPLLDSRRARRSRQKEREREKIRQLEADDEEVTNNEDDIKADLELLAQMQAKEDGDQGASFDIDETMKRLKSMETVLERRGKELEIARWKLKCVEVDRRSIEAEHQKALSHFYERAERAEARLRLVDNATTEASNGKGSPEPAKNQAQGTISLQEDSSVHLEASQANSDSAAPSLSTSCFDATPHLTDSADDCPPATLISTAYHFSDSPYTSSKYPPHPFASEYKISRRDRRASRNGQANYREVGENGNSTLSPRGKDFVLDTPAYAGTKAASGPEDSVSSETSDSEDDIEILLDSSYSRSPSMQPSVPHSRVPSGSLLNASAPASAAMTESRTVGLGIESSPSSSDASKLQRKATVDFVGSLPSFTISHPPTSPPDYNKTE